MKILKKKFQKIKHPNKPILKLPTIKIKRKQGRWCEYYEGRLPYPAECSYNKTSPIGAYFKKGKMFTTHKREKCPDCKRSVDWRSWKDGDWDRIQYAISQGDDLTDMNPPNQGEE